MKPRIIVCGLGRTGYKIFCLLKQQGARVTGISNQPLTTGEVDVVVGKLQSAETLLAAGIQEAQALVIASNDDAVNLAILIQARVLNPQIRVINRLFNASLGDRLDHTLPNHFSMSVASLSAPTFTFAALGNDAIGQLKVFQQTWPIHEELIHLNHPWRGRSLAELWDERARMLIYYLPANNPTDLISAVVEKRQLELGDRLIVATQPQMLSNQRSLQQHLTILLTRLQQFQQHIQPTVAGFVFLLLTIIIATLTYTIVELKISIIDALYFSVGMITGAGGNEAIAEDAPASIKVFTVVMMLVGAAVIGVCYALLNDLILGTRIKQLWRINQVPKRHHYVVCGLGGIGMHIVNQLHTQGCDVVVIETDGHNRFLSTLYALNIPLIQSDARLTSTLELANIDHAAALIAVTSNDVANLEIALTAKALAPRLPVIARNQDPQFAPLAQQVFDFEAVLSPADLAAPSFAAAALGGRILGNGMTADSLWVALATLITPSHPFHNRRVKEAAMDADFVPLYLEMNNQTVHGWNLLEMNLSAGDVLYLTMPANRLEELWRTNIALHDRSVELRGSA